MFNRSAHVHKEKTKGTTRSGATAPTERNCADKAPMRQQSATHKRSKIKSPFCVVLKTYHLDNWILHKTCLKHSNFLNRKTVCTIVSTWNIMATAMGQGTEENTNKLRQGSKHSNYNILAPESKHSSNQATTHRQVFLHASDRTPRSLRVPYCPLSHPLHWFQHKLFPFYFAFACVASSLCHNFHIQLFTVGFQVAIRTAVIATISSFSSTFRARSFCLSLLSQPFLYLCLLPEP